MAQAYFKLTLLGFTGLTLWKVREQETSFSHMDGPLQNPEFKLSENLWDVVRKFFGDR